MKLRLLFAAALAACMASGAAFAHAPDRHGHHGHRYDRHHHEYRHHGHDRHHGWRHGGVGPHYNIYRGERLPRAYWGRDYRVGSWHRYALPRPPYGHHWVRAGGDYLLVDGYSGRVIEVVVRR